MEISNEVYSRMDREVKSRQTNLSYSFRSCAFSDDNSLFPSLNKTNKHEKHNCYLEPVIPASNNIMFDHRVVRGNTYGLRVETDSEQRNKFLTKRNWKARVEQEKERQRKAILPPGTPPPVKGRVHIEIQTDEYIEDLTPYRPFEKSVEIQTDDVPERPLSPLFIPAKIGVDVVLQTENNNDESSSSELGVDNERVINAMKFPIPDKSTKNDSSYNQ
uniref:Uncharacterized protein n=1 Tax=Leptocylindrus danicus TaxID=163516 RepID=A0A7S2LTL9_9STRA|mmetsp:Transcript_8954/g.13300  ORF Transcript_8954/g.13300 Transcript_8954/m.13300 type:complete len:217 (+) Transcript_8954:93-743(+)